MLRGVSCVEGRGWGGGGGWKDGPRVGDDDVVDGGVLFAEAGEADAEDHFGVWRWACGVGWW